MNPGGTTQQTHSGMAPGVPGSVPVGSTQPQAINIPVPAYSIGQGLRFVLVIEGTVATTNLWPDARAMYVEPLLREMDRGNMGSCEFAVVVFRSRDGSYAGAVVESSGWLSSVAEVRQVLDGVQLLGGGLCETNFCDCLLEVMTLLEQPSGIASPLGAHPPCQALIVCTSDFNRSGVVLDYPSVPHPPNCDPDAKEVDSGAVMFRRLANGSWRHNHLSLLAAMKHSHHMSVSVVTIRDKHQTNLAMFAFSMLGYCAQAGSIPSVLLANKQAIANANVPIGRGHMVLIASDWPAARNTIMAERNARQGPSRQAQMQAYSQAQLAQQQQMMNGGLQPPPGASSGGMNMMTGSSTQTNASVPTPGMMHSGNPGTGGSRMPTPNTVPMPSPALGTTPQHINSPLPMPMHMDGMVPQPANPGNHMPMLHTGMIPTPPSAPQSIQPQHQQGMNPTTQVPPSAVNPWTNKQAPPALPTPAMQGTAAARTHASPNLYPSPVYQSPQVPDQGMQQQGGMAGMYPGMTGHGVAPMGRQGSLTQPTSQSGGYPGQPGYQQPYMGQQQQPQQQQGSTAAGGASQQQQQQYLQQQHQMMMSRQQQQQQQQSQQQQHWGGAPPAQPTPGPGNMTTPPLPAAPGMKPVVWVGRLAIHHSLLPSLGMSSPISLGGCTAESSISSRVFDTWPRELVISALTPQREINSLLNSLQTSANPAAQRPVKVSLRITEPTPPNMQLAAAFAALVDEMAAKSLFGNVPLGMGMNGRELRIVVQLKNKQLPALDSQIMCAFLM